MPRFAPYSRRASPLLSTPHGLRVRTRTCYEGPTFLSESFEVVTPSSPLSGQGDQDPIVFQEVPHAQATRALSNLDAAVAKAEVAVTLVCIMREQQAGFVASQENNLALLGVGSDRLDEEMEYMKEELKWMENDITRLRDNVPVRPRSPRRSAKEDWVHSLQHTLRSMRSKSG